MNIEFTSFAWEEFAYWIENDPTIVERINSLLQSIRQTPFQGLGKPEPLKYNLKGFWSRRITDDHRLIYQITGHKGKDQKCSIIQCKFHYNDK